MIPIHSWGRLSGELHDVRVVPHLSKVSNFLKNSTPGIAFGMGRSYGDECLNPRGILWSTRSLDHFLEFNEETGHLKCEPGVLLRDIQNLVVPRGWMLPVTPGSQFVTVGGAIANDVHGKNHHRLGTFGEHIVDFQLARTDGTFLECSRTSHSDWFSATIGGMGLTGLILSVSIQLRKVTSPYLETESIPYQNLEEYEVLSEESEKDWEYTVSWIDCLSESHRGIFMRANHVNSTDLTLQEKSFDSKLKLPFTPPMSLVNQWSLKPFNYLYYRLQKGKIGKRVQHYQPFFYPLDHIKDWNKMYGPNGFYQFQCVLPKENGITGIKQMLNTIKSFKEGSFLAVLKTFNQRAPAGMMSFPMEGYTLALDFPNKGKVTHQLFNQLNAIVKEYDGRIYMAKDASMPKELFEKAYANLREFMNFRDSGISSAMSRRLMGN